MIPRPKKEDIYDPKEHGGGKGPSLFDRYLLSSNLVKEIILEKNNVRAELFKDVKSSSSMGYEYYLDVFELDSGDKLLTVTSERNMFRNELGGSSHVLCMFKQSKHINFGGSNEYSDIEKFEKADLKIALKYLDF